jgi:hypothetical protein
MTIFVHHVGDENSRRDFPHTIGTHTDVVHRDAASLGPFSSLVPATLDRFQIWGIPNGASQIYERLKPDDWFLLVGALGDGGGVEYVGKVVHVLHGPQRELSKFLWTEDRFPWVFFLRGEMRHIPWPDFLSRLQYSANYDPRGHVFGIGQDRMKKLGYQTDYELVRAICA